MKKFENNNAKYRYQEKSSSQYKRNAYTKPKNYAGAIPKNSRPPYNSSGVKPYGEENFSKGKFDDSSGPKRRESLTSDCESRKSHGCTSLSSSIYFRKKKQLQAPPVRIELEDIEPYKPEKKFLQNFCKQRFMVRPLKGYESNIESNDNSIQQNTSISNQTDPDENDNQDVTLTNFQIPESEIDAVLDNQLPSYGVQGKFEDESPLPPIDPNEEIMFLGLPTNIVRFGMEIPFLDIPEEIFTTGKFGLYISEVHSPYKFWSQLEKYSENLDELTQNMRYFYEDCDEEYNMDAFYVLKGRACAALWYGIWHRAEIVKDISDTSVNENNLSKARIHFLDYGTVASVPIKDLRFLHKEFGFLPRQAVRCRLALVRPPKTAINWLMEPHHDAVEVMLEYLHDVLLNAELYAYEADERILHVSLCIAHDHKIFPPVNITTIMKFRGVCTVLTKEEEMKRWPELNELYPTFQMLEMNEYPTYAELIEADNRHDDQLKYFEHDSKIHYYSETIIALKKKFRTVYDVKESSVIRVENRSTPPPAYDEQWGAEYFDNLNITIERNKRIRNIDEFKMPNVLKCTTGMSEIDCVKQYLDSLFQKSYHLRDDPSCKKIEDSKVGLLMEKLLQWSK